MRLRWDRIMLLLATVIAVAVAGIWTAHAAGSDPRPAATAAPARKAAPLPRPDPGGCPATPGKPVSAAPGSAARTVALTFDDGPGDWTLPVLKILHEQKVKASFFVIGTEAHRHPELVAAAAADGHLIGNHTWSHVPPARGQGWNGPALKTELGRTDAALKAALTTGSCWFRPPEGVTAGTAAVARSRGLAVALWSVDTEDWKVEAGEHSDPQARLSRTIALNAVAGASQEHPVVLLHDGGGYRGATVAALPSIIAFYRAAGYTFVRLDGR